MKKVLILTMIAVVAAVSQAWTLLDNFDTYNNTDTHTTVATEGIWTSVFNGTGNSHIIDFGYGQALQAIGGSGWRGAERDLTGTGGEIAVDTIKTYFWQVQVYDMTGNYVEPGGSFYDIMMGLSPDVSYIDENNSWTDFGPMPFIDNGPADPFIVANGATSPWWAGISAETWVNVWVVVDNNAAAPTYDAYYSIGTDAPTLLQADAYWRGAEDWDAPAVVPGLALNAIGFMAAGASGSAVLIDNIYFADGEDLTMPAIQSVPAEDPITGILGTELSLINGGFALPGGATTGVIGVPGWQSNETTWDPDTGIRVGSAAGEATDGDDHYWSEDCNEDGPIWNIADVNMVEGTTYTFTADLQGRWGCDTITMSVVADDDPNVNLYSEVKDVANDNNGVYYPSLISYTATASDDGKKIGIKFQGEDDWMRVDNVHIYKDYTELHGVINQAPDGTDIVPATPIGLSWTPTNDPNADGSILEGTDEQVLYYYIGDIDGTVPDINAYLAASGVSLAYDATSYSIASGIDYDQYCLWRVDSVVNGVTYTGKTILFTSQSADLKPVLTAGSNWITWPDEVATLTADVNDFGEGDVADVDNVWTITSDTTPWSAAMQMYDRSGYTTELATLEANYGVDPNLYAEWIGTDARGALSVLEPLTLTLSGVPAGTYTWTSYHHDMFDQTGPYDVTVIDSSGSATTTGLDVTNGTQEPNQMFITTITSDGSDIQLIFENTGTENNTSFFVMNGFVLSDGVNPDLAIDFGLPTTEVAAGFQAYVAEHEVEATFTSQVFSGLGGSITVTPSWNSSSYYVTLTDASSDPLAPAADFASNWPGEYTIELNSTDRGGSLGDQAADPVQMIVTVAADECAAATASGIEYNLYDSDDDCDVDIIDFAAFAIEWLDDIKLTEPAAN